MRTITRVIATCLLFWALDVSGIETNRLNPDLMNISEINQPIYEYAILEVYQAQSGRIKLYLQIAGADKGSIETNKEGVIRIKESNGSFTVLNSEIVALNYLGKQGYKYVELYQVTILGNDVARYIFEKESGN